jgi:hypothetical protein
MNLQAKACTTNRWEQAKACTTNFWEQAKACTTNLAIMLLVAGSLLMKARAESPVVIEPGNAETEGVLQYGWSYAEQVAGGGTRRWIEGYEGEILLPGLSAGTAYQLDVDAMPICRDLKIQNMGLFFNGKYLDEWIMNTNGTFEVYRTRVPGGWVKVENRLILRGGFVHSPEGEPRELSIAVRRISLTPEGADE